MKLYRFKYPQTWHNRRVLLATSNVVDSVFWYTNFPRILEHYDFGVVYRLALEGDSDEDLRERERRLLRRLTA